MNIKYDPATGIFSKGKKIYKPNRPDGYIRITHDGKPQYAHRLAFLLMTGEWPNGVVDHINRDTTDNRWVNLRDTNQSANVINGSLRRKNKSGLTGVYAEKQTGMWKAYIRIDGKQITLLRSPDFFEAVCARKSAESIFIP